MRSTTQRRARLPACFAFFRAPASDVGSVAVASDDLAHLGRFIARVQAQVLLDPGRHPRLAGGLHGGRLARQRAFRQLHIVSVGPVQHQPNGNALGHGRRMLLLVPMVGYSQQTGGVAELAFDLAFRRPQANVSSVLGAAVFANAESVTQLKVVRSVVENGRFGKVVPAVGAGLHLNLNKSARTNLAVDYGFRLDGSRGLALNLGEVF